MGKLPLPNHEAVTDDEKIEWLLEGMYPEAVMSMMRRLAVAEELGQVSITRYLHKLIRGWAANAGRVKQVFEIARNEEAMHVASEVFAPRRGV